MSLHTFTRRLTCCATRFSTAGKDRIGIYRPVTFAQSRNQHNQRDEPMHPHQLPSLSQDEHDPPEQEGGTLRVRYIRPAIWALAVSGGIFYGLAYLEARKQIQQETAKRSWLQVPQWGTVPSRGSPTPTSVTTTWWARLDGASKLSAGLIGTNIMVHASSFVFPTPWNLSWHIPARNVNYTLFTSMFVHGGAMHIAFNMYALSQFLPTAYYSRLFEGNSNHLLAFYLSTGVLSGFAQHLATLLPVARHSITPHALIPCGGASGALFGVLGVFCMQYPTAGLGIMLLPFSMEAQYFFPAIMLFDLIGLIKGYSWISLGHGAHLGGAVLGIAYSQLDGKTHLWNPLVCHWKRRLQKQD